MSDSPMSRACLDSTTVIDIHDELITLTGDAAGIRNAGALESALLRPQFGYYNDIFEEDEAIRRFDFSHSAEPHSPRVRGAYAALRHVSAGSAQLGADGHIAQMRTRYSCLKRSGDR